MAKLVFALGIVIGLAILAIAATAAPESSTLAASGTGPRGGDMRAASMTKGSCTLRQVALDEGYGISRTIFRKVCHIDD